MKLVDRLLFSTTATGTSTVSVAAAVAGYRTVAQAIADGDLAQGETIPLAIELGSVFEISEFTVTSATLLTRVQVLGSSNGGAAAVFPAGAKEALCTAPADYLNGVKITDLGNVAPSDSHILMLTDPATGQTFKATVAALRSLFGAGAPAGDTNAPTFAGGAAMSSSNVTPSGFTLTGPAATDNVGVARYEYSLDAGTTWINASLNLSVAVIGRTASTSYPTRWRAVDAAGNVSASLSLTVVTAAPSGDTTAPSMSGSITVSAQSSSGYTFAYGAGSDNVAVDHYDTSIDGGTTWASNGLSLSRVVTGRPVSTTDSLRVRAVDAAGNISNVLTGTATTLAAAPAGMAEQYVIKTSATPGGANYPATTIPTSGTRHPDGYFNSSPGDGIGARIFKKSDGTAPPVGEVLTFTWGTSGTVPPVLANQTQTGQKVVAQRLGGWTDGATGNQYYGLYQQTGTLYVWGPAGNYYFWVFFSDGSALVYDNGTGTAIPLVLT